jgi:hypothetical protein
VTISGYGSVALAFARGKPIELLDGRNLLHLLKEHAGIDAKGHLLAIEVIAANTQGSRLRRRLDQAGVAHVPAIAQAVRRRRLCRAEAGGPACRRACRD